MFLRYLMLFSCLLMSTQSYSFDEKKCRKISSSGNGVGLFLSTTSFVSSTGECAMIGMGENDKKVFLVNNSDPLKVDMSRGSGEYLDAYAILSGCDLKAKEYLPTLLQKNYVEIWGEEEKETKAIYDSLEKIMNNDSKIKSGCSFKS
nr:hypothetical protein BHI3_19080 [Bacteriovorax sp. HI3]